MLKIKLDYVDELCEIMMDMSCITYLQALARRERDEGAYIADYEYISSSLERYLWDRQEETVERMKNLLEKDDFTVIVK